MTDFSTAIVSASAVLVVGYGTNFLAEQYRRFLDTRSLASALRGELASHGAAFPDLKVSIDRIIASGRRGVFREVEAPQSPIFEKLVEKIGLLGPLAGEVAYIYERIRAFRSTLAMLIREGGKMDDAEYAAYLQALHLLIADNEARFKELLQSLDGLATARFEWFGSSLLGYLRRESKQ